MDSPKDRKSLSKVKVNVVCFGMFEKVFQQGMYMLNIKTFNKKKV